MTQLWHKTTELYFVELMIGQAWVRHADYSVIGDAIVESQRMASEQGVSKTRVCSLKTVQVYTVEHEEDRPIIASVEKKLRPTGKTITCRACSVENQFILNNGTEDWVTCTACNRTYPV